MNSTKRPGETELQYFLRSVGMAAFSACVAETLTIPVDTAKVRLQLQRTPEGQRPRYAGLVGTARTVAKEEGALALFGGLSAGLQRQLLFAGLRIGLYVPVRDLITGPLPQGQNPSLLQKVLAGILTGAIAITVANPTDLVKVKMQAQGAGRLQGKPPRYSSCLDCYSQIVRGEGVRGLWTGWGPNVMRNSVINAAELASYDQYKQMVLQSGLLRDGVCCHLLCACCAGFTATVVGSPVDVLKTRIMNAAPGTYSSPLDCIWQTLRHEGLVAFYKGFGPNVMRIAGWNCFMFLTLEQVKKAMG